MITELDDLLQRVRVAVEFVDGLHPLLVLLMAWFLHAQTKPIYGSDRYVTLISHVAGVTFLLYLGCHFVAGDLEDVWNVVTHFGRGVLVFQIVVALLNIFHAEILSPFNALAAAYSLCCIRLPRNVLKLAKWAWSLLPDPPQPPPEPILTRAEWRKKVLDESRVDYRQKIRLTRETKLPHTEQRAIRDEVRRSYLARIKRLLED